MKLGKNNLTLKGIQYIKFFPPERNLQIGFKEVTSGVGVGWAPIKSSCCQRAPQLPCCNGGGLGVPGC